MDLLESTPKAEKLLRNLPPVLSGYGVLSFSTSCTRPMGHATGLFTLHFREWCHVCIQFQDPSDHASGLKLKSSLRLSFTCAIVRADLWRTRLIVLLLDPTANRLNRCTLSRIRSWGSWSKSSNTVEKQGFFMEVFPYETGLGIVKGERGRLMVRWDLVCNGPPIAREWRWFCNRYRISPTL